MYIRGGGLPVYLVPLLIGLCVIHGPPWHGHQVRAAQRDIPYTDDEDLEKVHHGVYSGSGDSQKGEEESPGNFTELEETGHPYDKGISAGEGTELKTGLEPPQEETRKPQLEREVSSAEKRKRKGKKGRKASPSMVDRSGSSEKKKKVSKVKLSNLQPSKPTKSWKKKNHSKPKQKSRKQTKRRHKKTKVKKVFKKSDKKKKHFGKTHNLKGATNTLTLSGRNQGNTHDNVNKKQSKDYHIRHSPGKNSHHTKQRNGHQTYHSQKRWRKNKSSNHHGYGKTGDPGKKLTFEDRWPGCFSKYQSCFRNSNCCADYCHRFTWLHFGFCL